MRSFVFGIVVGAIAMWLYLNGLEPLVNAVAGMWEEVSAPPAERR